MESFRVCCARPEEDANFIVSGVSPPAYPTRMEISKFLLEERKTFQGIRNPSLFLLENSGIL